VKTQHRRGQERNQRAASIDGTWYLSGDRNQPCDIEQRDRDQRTVFTNERGESANGTVGGGRIRVPGWDDASVGGLHGQIQGSVILWRNGTYWTRRPIF
jgi:hypothetical protein